MTATGGRTMGGSFSAAGSLVMGGYLAAMGGSFEIGGSFAMGDRLKIVTK